MSKPSLIIQEQSIFQLMNTLNEVITYAGSVEETLLQAIRDLASGDGVEIAPVADATYSTKGVVTLADSVGDTDTYVVSVALLNLVVGQLTSAMGTLTALETTTKSTLVAAINEVRQGRVSLSTSVGTLSGLTTTDKSTIVGAINELAGRTATDFSTSIGTLANLTTTAKSNLVLAINEVKSIADKVGALTGLTTTDKNSIVGSINEVKTKADTVGTVTSLTTSAKTNTVVAINEVVSNLGDLTTLTTTAKGNLVSAVNELKSTVGNLPSLSTTAKTSVVTAINELVTSLGALASLNTTAKTSLVLALNEVNTKVGITTSLNTTNKADVVTALNEVNTKVGTTSGLTTIDKSSLVSAINEVKQYANDGKTAIATAVTAKGVTASPADTFTSLATKIGQIPTGGGGGGLTINGAVDVTLKAGADLTAGDLAGATWDIGDNYEFSESGTNFFNGISSILEVKFSPDSSTLVLIHYVNDAYRTSIYSYNVETQEFTLVTQVSPVFDYYEAKIATNRDGSKIAVHYVNTSDYTRSVYFFQKSGSSYVQTFSMVGINRYTQIHISPTTNLVLLSNSDYPYVKGYNFDTGVQTWTSGGMLSDDPFVFFHPNSTDVYMFGRYSPLKKFTVDPTTASLTEVATPQPPYSLYNSYRACMLGDLLNLQAEDDAPMKNYVFNVVTGTFKESKYIYDAVMETSIEGICTAVYFNPSEGNAYAHVVRIADSTFETIFVLGSSSSDYSLSKEILFYDNYNETTKVKGTTVPELGAFPLESNTISADYADYFLATQDALAGEVTTLKKILSK